jgi:hypothetical protein
LRRFLTIGLVLASALVVSATTTFASETVGRNPSCAAPGRVPQEGGVVASRDGRTLAWSRWAWRSNGELPGFLQIVVSARDGSRARPVSVPGRGKDFAVALAPDGSEALIQREIANSFLTILASTRRTESRFVTHGDEAEIRRRWRTPEWSPDGRFRVVGEANGLLIVPADGGPSRRIETPETGENYDAAWSPGGQRIAFLSWNQYQGANRLFSVRVDGSGLRDLAEGQESVNGHAWSPDGARVAYGINDTGSHGGYRISVARADGSGGRDVAGGLDGPDRRSAGGPSWIDSRTIVFSSSQYRNWPNRVADIHSIRSDGSGERRITYQCHLGTGGDNTLIGSDLADTIRTFAGNDRIGAGKGVDDIDAGPGNDSITSDDESPVRRGARDIVRCGPGRDTVIADRRDRVGNDCERVKRQ